ncbi:MAG: hypothetical protein ACPL68_04395, partial [Candidatus Hydrothermia bacterium]
FRAYGGPKHDVAGAILQAEDGGFLIAGETWSFGAGKSDILVLKLSAGGSLEWARTYGGPGIDMATSLAGTTDGGCLVLGQTESYGAGEYDLILMKLRDGGGVEWAETFGGPGSDSVGQAISLSGGELAVVGSSGSWGGGLSDIFVLGLPDDGNYPGCLVPCEPAVGDAFPSESTPTLAGGALDFTILPVNPTLVQCFPSAMDICSPSVEEASGHDLCPPVVCWLVPGGAVFRSSVDVFLRIYAVDGKVVYSGQLKSGANLISLETGAYLWMAEAPDGTHTWFSRVGKAVVR